MSGHSPWADVRLEKALRTLAATVPLEYRSDGTTRVRLPLIADDPAGREPTLLLDAHAEVAYPIFVFGDLGAEFTIAEARELAFGLLALIREYERRVDDDT